MARFIAIILCFAFAITANAAKPQRSLRQGEPYYEFRPNQVLVKFEHELSGAKAYEIASRIGGKPAYRSELLDFYRIEFPEGTDVGEAVLYFRNQAGVEWANFNYIAKAQFTPNDTYYEFQWHYPIINLPQAWDVTRGSADVIVGDADQGWQFNHEDWVGVQVVSPRDFVENDADPSAPNLADSHGMHTGGTIIAATNNSLGVAGIAANCRFMPIRVLDDQGSGSAEWIADGISWAAQNNCDVLNLSLGFGVQNNQPPQDPGPPLSTAVQQAAAAGVIMSVSSANDNADYVSYPAAYDVCIAVGATDFTDQRAPYSNRGTALDLTAPGGNTEVDANGDTYPDGVLSTGRNAQGQDWYWFSQGTSMAAPHVTGVAALCLAAGIPANCVREALENTAVDLGAPGWDVVFGHGRIDANAAVRYTCGSNPGNVIYAEHFDAVAQGWTQTQNGVQAVGWNLLADLSPDPDCDPAPQAGANAIWHDDEDLNDQHQDDWLISPVINLPAGATDMELTFWQRNCFVEDWYEYHALLYRFDGGPDWSQYEEYDQVQEAWQQISVPLDNNTAGHTLQIALRYQGVFATEWFIDEFAITGNTDVAADNRPAIVLESFKLGQPYPNPFNSMAQIPFELVRDARVTLGVYNVLGQNVATIVNNELRTAGSYTVSWNAMDFTSGIYLVRLESEGRMKSAKMLLVK